MQDLGDFLAFYSVKNADAHVNMLLDLYFPILLISFELIDKPPVAMTSVSWNDIFAVFKSIFGAREGANKSYGTRAFTGNPLILND